MGRKLLAYAALSAFTGSIPIWLVNAEQSRAQEPGETKDRKEFEVASIKPSDPNKPMPSLTVSPGGRFTATNMTLRRLVIFAYGVSPQLLTGGPGWMDSDKYDVVAKPPEGSISGTVGHRAEVSGPKGPVWSWTMLSSDTEGEREFREMLQALLADRFQLKAHRETRELPIYALVIAKNGPKLQASQIENGPFIRFGMGQLTFQGVAMRFLANMLSQPMLAGRVVQDRTGLKGKYDFKLEWMPDVAQIQRFRAGGGGYGTMSAQPLGPPAAGGDAGPEPSGPSIFAVLPEQLGLKLEPLKGQVEVLVIDHAEKPTEN